MKTNMPNRSGFVWFELLLALALLLLVFQLVPSLRTGILWAFNIHNWSRTIWFAANVVVLLLLVTIRFGPDLYGEWRQRNERRAAASQKQHNQQELRERRESLDRMKEAKERRVY